MPLIQVIKYEEAEGRLREIYDDLLQKRGKIAEVHQIQSLNPESIVKHMDLYMTVMFGPSPLTRAQREMIAVVVSAANKCEYCQQHHGAALNHYWKDEERLEKLKKSYSSTGLSKADELLCKYAYELTIKAGDAGSEGIVSELKKEGISDRGILDATLVTGYFNFVNRMVIGLGVELEKDKGEGFKY